MTFDEWVCKIYGINFELDDQEGYSCAMAAWQAAMEECAKVCEEHPDGLNMLGGAFVTCAAAIRARGTS